MARSILHEHNTKYDADFLHLSTKDTIPQRLEWNTDAQARTEAWTALLFG